MNEFVNVIVTSYNNKLYIKKCLDSIDKQNYKNINIIIIDDNSTDGSFDIIKNFEINSNHNVKILRNEQNKGVSYSRNIGINNASGKYITFVDSDDIISENHISNLVKNIKIDDNVGISVCGYKQGNSIINSTERKLNSKIINSKNEVLKQFLGFGNVQGYVWNKLFYLEIIKSNKLMFNENIYIYEDMLFVLKYFYSNICRIALSDEITYFYRTNVSGIVNNSKTEKIIKKCKNERLAFDIIYKDIVLKHKDNKDLDIYYNIRFICVLSKIICTQKKLNEKVDINYVSTLRKCFKNYKFNFYLNSFLPLKYKLFYSYRIFKSLH